MQCFHCQETIPAKSWIHLENMPSKDEDDKETLAEKHICGYSCYKRLSESNALPKELWSHIVNKEDYKGLIRPVPVKMKKSFEYLTTKEIYDLNDMERDNYFRDKETQMELDPNLTKIYDEINEEDERTAYLEFVSSDESIDDY
jgi:hypothetical protein